MERSGHRCCLFPRWQEPIAWSRKWVDRLLRTSKAPLRQIQSREVNPLYSHVPADIRPAARLSRILARLLPLRFAFSTVEERKIPQFPRFIYGKDVQRKI